jgi:hypothetical protein
MSDKLTKGVLFTTAQKAAIIEIVKQRLARQEAAHQKSLEAIRRQLAELQAPDEPPAGAAEAGYDAWKHQMFDRCH